jgi:hypothetical protein
MTTFNKIDGSNKPQSIAEDILDQQTAALPPEEQGEICNRTIESLK